MSLSLKIAKSDAMCKLLSFMAKDGGLASLNNHRIMFPVDLREVDDFVEKQFAKPGEIITSTAGAVQSPPVVLLMTLHYNVEPGYYKKEVNLSRVSSVSSNFAISDYNNFETIYLKELIAISQYYDVDKVKAVYECAQRLGVDPDTEVYIVPADHPVIPF